MDQANVDVLAGANVHTWSRDENWLAYASGSINSDVILITDSVRQAVSLSSIH